MSDTQDTDTTTDAGELNHEYTRLPNEPGIEHSITYGTRYWAQVNGTQPYGVFVTLANFADRDNEVCGFIHETALAPLRSPVEYSPHDEVGVMLVDENEQHERGRFEIVAHLTTQSVDSPEEFLPRQAAAAMSDTPSPIDTPPHNEVDE